MWDELRNVSGEVRPHWEALMQSLTAMGREEFVLRMENGRRILREHGVSCFSAGPGDARDEPWDLDFMPFVLSAEEWRELGAGLVQRARLLNWVLSDLHGVQRLVRDGFIPAPLVFANSGYLRACQAVRVPGHNYLHLYAADLARGPDGRWRVLADRTQAPAGLGFALENRSVLTRVLPEAVQATRPRSLSDTLRLRRETLRRLAPAGSENPAIALLTPGARNEAYFEHAYLARLLGFTLVEGGDLTVRDRQVWLKTLEGLRRVDVILRLVADSFCDPLALRGDSLIGVAGLVEATRAGRVTVSNALGSGLVESPAFLPFLPALSMHLLGEELRLQSVDTWWCGQARERRYVQEHLEELFLRPAFSAISPQSCPGTLDQATRAEWLALLHERPHDLVGQKEIPLSRAPIGAGNPRPVVLRLFVLWDGQDYFVMPGGIARLVAQDTLGTVALSLAGGCKDVWVLPDAGQQPELSYAVTAPPPMLERLASDLPSRTVENLFWLGRYAERLEQLLRVCRSTTRCLVNESANAQTAALAELLRRLRLAPEPPTAAPEREALQASVLALLFDESHSAGARQLLKRIHTLSFSVRDRLSADTWRILNLLGTDAGQRAGHLPLVFASSALNRLVLDLAAFSGMEMENMTRGHGWAFLDLGRRIERGISIARLVEAAIRCTASHDFVLELLLEIADSTITYRRRYFAEPLLAGVLELLLFDPSNPRGLAFQLTVLQRHAASLPAGPNPDSVAELKHRLNHLAAGVDRVRPESTDGSGTASEAAHWLAGLTAELGGISDLLTHVYFSQVLPRVS